MARPVSLLKWYFVLSPTSDEDQTTVIPHKLYSYFTIVVSYGAQILENGPLTETRGL
jgi:hypothetical protein